MKDYSDSDRLANRLIRYIADHNLISIIEEEGVPVAIWNLSAVGQLSAFLSDMAGELEEEFKDELQ